MHTILEILTRPDDALARAVIAQQSQEKSLQVTVMDLTIAHPDYQKLLEAIFEAEAVHVW